jgi:transcriptional regulator with XRE-family HTH domain
MAQPQHLGATIRALRGDYPARDLAARAGISAQYLCDIELGRRIPPPDTILNIVHALDVDRDPLPLLWRWVIVQLGEADASALAEWVRAGGEETH